MEFGDRLGLVQGQRAIKLALGEFGLGPRIGELAIGLFGDRLERSRIDDVKQIPGPDHRAIAKLDVGDGAADPGADLHFLDRLETPGELVPVGHHPLDRRRHCHRRCCCGSGRLGWLFAATAERESDQQDQRRRPAQQGSARHAWSRSKPEMPRCTQGLTSTLPIGPTVPPTCGPYRF